MRKAPANNPETARQSSRPQGADCLSSGGVRYRIWAPEMERVEVVLFDEKGQSIRRSIPLEDEENGFFSAVDEQGRVGDLYKFRLDGEGLFPDPFSRWQPTEVFDPSMVIDPRSFSWQARDWERFPLAESVIYELHIGTFTPEGTFRSAIDKLNHLVALGITTIEIMPVAAFPGQRNWGYDGVMLFAPDSSYGHPDDLRALVDAAHQRGLNVLLDVVYNHFGPDGNFLSSYSPHYFNPDKKTPWGDAINFSGPGAQHVRAVFLANVAYWMDEFRIDGFRIDATHEILDDSTPHILAEIARTVHERGGILVAEDDRNLARLAVRSADGGDGLDGLWADDFHHTVRVGLLQQREAYFANFTGTPQELQETLSHGWLYCGQVAPVQNDKRGTPTGKLRIDQFVHCISNHDQVGNRAFGERLNHLVKPGAYRAASALLCLTPSTPMLFMGQEWAASTPFLYFTDHKPELGKLVTEGRRREFKDFFEAVHETREISDIPDPQGEETYRRSKLDWEEIQEDTHRQMLALYRELLELRKNLPALRRRSRETLSVKLLDEHVVGIRIQETKHSGLLILVDLLGGHTCHPGKSELTTLPSGWTWQPFLSSNERRFGGTRSSPTDISIDRISMPEPEVILLKPAQKP